MSQTAASSRLDEIRALESQHVLQTYRRNPVAFVRGEGVYLFDTEDRSTSTSCRASAWRRSATRIPGLAAALADQARHARAHVEPVLPSAAGAAGRAPRAPVGPAARVLLQQRHRGRRGLPQVRAPLLVHAGRHDAHAFVALDHGFAGRTMGSLSVTWDDHYRAPFEPLHSATSASCRPTIRRRSLAAVDETTAAIIVEPIQGEGGVRPLSPAFADGHPAGVRANGRAAHRRRGAERPRAHGHAVPVPGARPDARSRVDRQGARRRLPGRRRPGLGARRQRDLVRRSRHDLRRQPARVPRRAGLPRGARGGRPARARPPCRARTSRRGLRALAARHAIVIRGPRRGPDVGPRTVGRRGARRPGRPRARASSSTARTSA